MKKRFTVLLLGAFVLTLSGTAVAQDDDLGALIKKYIGQNARNYVSPLMAGWASGLNGGFYHSADIHDILGFDVQVKLTFAGMTEEDKTFQFRMPDQITYGIYTLTAGVDYPSEISTPTVIGSDQETVVIASGSTPAAGQEILRLPGGLNLPAAPMIVPQVAIGLPFGIEVIGRFIPTTKLSNAGKVNFLGFGIRHDIDQYIPLLPLDIAVHFMTQKFNFMDQNDNNLIAASATAYGVEISKKLLILTLYGGFQLESSKWEIGPYTATFTQGTEQITTVVDKFEIEGKNTSRAIVGVRLLLAFLNVHADYSFATTPVLTLGAGITFR
ncbi:MAG: DUF6588 family protein [Bacteroidota bacterium]